MDSLTQITLGAAVGEAVLGKKIGNRAMFWGAVAGTIPDLDVLSKFILDDMGALAFHRGFMHSLTFAALMSWLLGWFVRRLYESNLYKSKIYKSIATLFGVLILGAVGFGVNLVAKILNGNWHPVTVAITLSVWLFLARRLWKYYLQKDSMEIRITYSEWVWFFFLTIVTHPILDCFTAFGTQIFQPFSDYRVAWNNISVADPLYTIWQIAFLVPAAFLYKKKKLRRIFVWLAIGLSSGYMLLTIWNKSRVDDIFEQSLAREGILAKRYMTSPSILSNILWNGIAETDSSYYYSNYSIFDSQKEFLNFIELKKDYSYIKGHENDRAIRILKWFSNGYFNVIYNKEGNYWQLNDLRYGSRDGTFDSGADYIFKFKLEKKNGEIRAYDTGRPRKKKDIKFSTIFDRWKGI